MIGNQSSTINTVEIPCVPGTTARFFAQETAAHFLTPTTANTELDKFKKHLSPKQFFEHFVEVQTLQDPKRNKYKPKIRFKLSTRFNTSYKMIRTQISLRLAYCKTYNKSQGQTLN